MKRYGGRPSSRFILQYKTLEHREVRSLDRHHRAREKSPTGKARMHPRPAGSSIFFYVETEWTVKPFPCYWVCLPLDHILSNLLLFPPKVIFKVSTLLYGNKHMASDHYVPSEAQNRFTKPFLQWLTPRLLPTLATTDSKQDARLYLSLMNCCKFLWCLRRRETSQV